MELSLDYPKAIHLETWAKCNAACTFCPYPILDRKGEKMSDELIAKILKDLEDIPKDYYFHLSPFKVNEPFLDKRIFGILESVNERMPNCLLRLFSNGSPLTEDKVDKISKLSNVEHLWISLNCHTEDEYESVMKIPFKTTVKRLDGLHKKKESGEFRHRVVISRVCDGTALDYEFAYWVDERYPKFELSMLKRESWLDFHDHDAIATQVPRTKCGRWYEVDITSTGVVSLCCMDGRCQYPIGDVSKQHVLEVYNSPQYRRMRAGPYPRQAYEPCSRCTY